jgi:hypothetical protein
VGSAGGEMVRAAKRQKCSKISASSPMTPHFLTALAAGLQEQQLAPRRDVNRLTAD